MSCAKRDRGSERPIIRKATSRGSASIAGRRWSGCLTIPQSVRRSTRGLIPVDWHLHRSRGTLSRLHLRSQRREGKKRPRGAAARRRDGVPLWPLLLARRHRHLGKTAVASFTRSSRQASCSRKMSAAMPSFGARAAAKSFLVLGGLNGLSPAEKQQSKRGAAVHRAANPNLEQRGCRSRCSGARQRFRRTSYGPADFLRSRKRQAPAARAAAEGRRFPATNISPPSPWASARGRSLGSARSGSGKASIRASTAPALPLRDLAARRSCHGRFSRLTGRNR